ncbi:MAG: hypothetical protein IT429_26645 [Gemmataceae bacterium]|nr:hypothetical protein [Gemmataceae bacterium]
MNRWSSVLCLGAAVLIAALCASCAPIDPPRTDKVGPTGGLTRPKQEIPIKLPPEIGGQKDHLQRRIEIAVDQVRRREVLTTNGFWTVFHAILGLGPKTIDLVDPVTKKHVNALDHICSGGEVRGMHFVETKYGVDVASGEMFVAQGHQDQFVAEMVQWGVPAERKFVLGKNTYTFQDFLNHSKMRASVTEKQELSWAVLIIGQHFGTDITWTNARGEVVRFEDVVRYEVNEGVEQAACGGTHRLFGLAWAYHLHLQRGGKTVGVWKDVADQQARCTALAHKYRNADGSLSTSFFKEHGNVPDMQLRMNTTGHMVEWLALTMTDEELREPWMEDAVNALTTMFFNIQNQQMEGGTMYHAAHGLLIYYARRYDPRRLDELGLQRPVMVLLPRVAAG